MPAAPALPGPLADLAPALDRYGYAAVAALVMVESFGVPVPAQTLLMVAGVYAGSGRLNVVLVAVIGCVAAITGDSVGLWIGRAGGRPLVLRVGRYVLLTESRLDRVTRVFEKHGGKIIIIARFVDGLRQFNGIVAGVAGMPWSRFLPYNAVGAVVWSTVFTLVGYEAGAHIGPIYQAVRRYEPVVLAVLVGIAVVIGVRAWRHHRRRGTEDAPDTAGAPDAPPPRRSGAADRVRHLHTVEVASMSLADRIGHKSRELRGRVKRATGRVTGDPVLEGEGLDQQVSGRLGQLGERLKDRFRGRRRR